MSWRRSLAWGRLVDVAVRSRASAALRAVGVAGWLMALVLSMDVLDAAPTRADGDAWNYLAAGERLNAGHPLYELSPGDRPVTLEPPYWPVPLLSPPFIAVVWRPLALLGEPAMVLWWAGGVAAMSVLVGWILRCGRALDILAITALSPVLALTAVSGNAMAYLVPLLALRHPAAVALTAAVKVTPVILGLHVGVRRTVAWGLTLAAVSLVGAGLDNHLAWLQSMLSTAPSPRSISALTGVPYAVVLAIAALVSLRSWRWAIVAVALSSPAMYFAPLAMLAAGVGEVGATVGETRNEAPKGLVRPVVSGGDERIRTAE